ncbi:hypothetical protein MKY59_18140 [Paenibacillus sp. FSL W8-0426]|uniref:hypothetical protein n=1 Tax=Paenibacillus sp. FSL W8-0426 TaxID=2921714 RepID=UPI0030DD0D96
MSTVAFWSPFAGSGCTSSSLIGAYAMGLQYRVRILLVNSGQAGSGVEALLPPIQEYEADSLHRFDEGGWDAIERLHASGALTKHNVKDHAKPLIKDRLDLLTGSMNNMERLHKGQAEPLNSLLNAANEYYDLVIVEAGQEGRDASLLLQRAEFVVVHLTQNMRELEQFFEGEMPFCMKDRKMHLVIGKYDPHARATLANIRRRFRYKGTMSAIPYTTGYLDAANRRDVGSFLQLHGWGGNEGKGKDSFSKHMAEFARLIMDGAGMRTILKRLERGA